jgi:alcohol dehydrogenase (NADP+)
VFPIPEALPTKYAAPMLCAGLTAFSPLVRNGCGPGKKVGIVGLGGIGHFGVLFAKALGAEVYAISRSNAKKSDALKLGADGFIATEDKDWTKPHKMTFDLIVNTASGSEGFDLSAYLSLLDVHARWVSVGLPEGEGQEVKSHMFMSNGCLIGASHLGSRKEMLRMLQLAADKNIQPWVEEIPISEAGCEEAGENTFLLLPFSLSTAQNLKTDLPNLSTVTRLKKNDVKYRFALTNFEAAFSA